MSAHDSKHKELTPFRLEVLTDDCRDQLARAFRRSSPAVKGFLDHRCSPEVAEDVLATTFEHAALKFLVGEGSVVTTGWLITVARRRLIDHWRTVGRYGRLLDQVGEQVESRPQSEFEVCDETLAEAMRALPDHYRLAMFLRYVMGYSLQEVATHLQVSYRSAEAITRRAKDKLAFALAI